MIDAMRVGPNLYTINYLNPVDCEMKQMGFSFQPNRMGQSWKIVEDLTPQLLCIALTELSLDAALNQVYDEVPIQKLIPALSKQALTLCSRYPKLMDIDVYPNYRQIEVGPVVYDITLQEDKNLEEQGLLGFHHRMSCRIAIHSKLPENAKHEILWHELFHAIDATLNVSMGEDMIRSSAWLWCMLLYQNPFFCDLIRETYQVECKEEDERAAAAAN